METKLTEEEEKLKMEKELFELEQQLDIPFKMRFMNKDSEKKEQELKLQLKTEKKKLKKRFYAACAAMQGILASGDPRSVQTIVKDAYNCADELLKQEEGL